MMTVNPDNAISRHPIPIRNGLVSYFPDRPVGRGRVRARGQRRRRSAMISTTMVVSSPAAITSCPSVLDIPVGSMSAVCRGDVRRAWPSGRYRIGRVAVVRLTEFRSLMQAQFGPLRAPSVAHDHVFSALEGRTVDEALSAGTDPKSVWAAVCADFDVPDTLRYGLPD